MDSTDEDDFGELYVDDKAHATAPYAGDVVGCEEPECAPISGENEGFEEPESQGEAKKLDVVVDKEESEYSDSDDDDLNIVLKEDGSNTNNQRRSTESWCTMPNSGMVNGGTAVEAMNESLGCGYNVSHTWSTTSFDANYHGFEKKPWRNPGVDVNDYFNFGFNEQTWKDYCNPGVKGREIEVEGGTHGRTPSVDLRYPRELDSDVVIQIPVTNDIEELSSMTPVETRSVSKTSNGASRSEKFHSDIGEDLHSSGDSIKQEVSVGREEENSGSLRGEQSPPKENYCSREVTPCDKEIIEEEKVDMKAKRERHRVTFSTGFLAGCIFSLIVALVAIVRTRNVLQIDGQNQYMNTMFPLYSIFGFIVLHILMYAGNIYYWRRYRVNYSFIFGFKQGRGLGYRQVLLVGFSIGVLALLCVIANLDMEVDPKTNEYKLWTELLPLFLLIVLFIVLVLPFNIFYRSSRLFFLTCLFHCVAAPLYKVTLPDFLVGDHLTSQVQAIRSVQFYICHYGWGDYKHRMNTCSDSDVYNTFLFIVAAIPYVWRLLQCLRRLFEEKNAEQGYNGLKYFLTIVAVCVRTAYSVVDEDHKFIWRMLAVIFSAIAAIFCTYWDLVLDWGLLNRTSKNRWLRDKLLVPQKKVYFIAMILNVLFRFAWLQTVLDFNFSFMHRQTMITVVASLEIIRHGIWNFFRLENEHVNNVGKYRAFKTVPLPFNYDEDDDKDTL